MIDHGEFNLNGFYLLNFQLKMLSPRLKLCLFMFTFMLLTKQMFLLLDLSLQVILESTAYGEMWMWGWYIQGFIPNSNIASILSPLS